MKIGGKTYDYKRKLGLSKQKINTILLNIWLFGCVLEKGRGKIWRYQSFNNFSNHIAKFCFIYSIQKSQQNKLAMLL